MNRLIVFLVGGWLLAAPLSGASENGELPKTIKTIFGKVYEEVTIKRVEPDGLLVMHSAGVTKVKFEELPKDLRERFGFDAEKAAAFAKDQARQQMAIRQQAAAAKQARAHQIRKAAVPVVEPPKILTATHIKNYWINSFPQPQSLDSNYYARKAEYERLVRTVRSGVLDDKARREALEWNILEYDRVGDYDRADATREDLKALEELIAQKRLASETARQSSALEQLQRQLERLEMNFKSGDFDSR